jgi:methyl-accepting chemotaxis protein
VASETSDRDMQGLAEASTETPERDMRDTRTRQWLSMSEAMKVKGISRAAVYRREKRGLYTKAIDGAGRVVFGIPLPEHSQAPVRGIPSTPEASVRDMPSTPEASVRDMPSTPEASVRDMPSTPEASVRDIRDTVGGQDGQSALTELTARIERLDEDKAHLRDQIAAREQALRDAEASHVDAADHMRTDYDARIAELRVESAQRVEATKARVIDLERELTVRDSRMADMQAERETEVSDLRGQVAILEAKVREVLEQRADANEKLANRIADLVDRQQEADARIYELAPVAERVPMLQAAVEEKDATLSEREQALQDREQELGNMRQDIDAIASRPVTGPVFRLLTKGKLRR